MSDRNPADVTSRLVAVSWTLWTPRRKDDTGNIKRPGGAKTPCENVVVIASVAEGAGGLARLVATTTHEVPSVGRDGNGCDDDDDTATIQCVTRLSRTAERDVASCRKHNAAAILVSKVEKIEMRVSSCWLE